MDVPDSAISENERASDVFTEQRNRQSGLVPAVDLDGKTWWVKPESVESVHQHSLAKLREQLRQPNPNAGQILRGD